MRPIQTKYPMGGFGQFSVNQVYKNEKSSQHSKKKRVSLITGKYAHYSSVNKRSKQYRRLQLTIYNYLERPSGVFAISYQLVM